MSAVDHLLEHYRSAVQRLVPEEPVLSVGLFTRASLVGPDGAVRPWAEDVALGLGTVHLHAVRFRPAVMEIEAVEILARWQIDGVCVTLQESALVRVVHVDAPGTATEVVELRAPRQIGAFDRMNDRLYEDLGIGVASEPVSTRPGS